MVRRALLNPFQCTAGGLLQHPLILGFPLDILITLVADLFWLDGTDFYYKGIWLASFDIIYNVPELAQDAKAWPEAKVRPKAVVDQEGTPWLWRPWPPQGNWPAAENGGGLRSDEELRLQGWSTKYQGPSGNIGKARWCYFKAELTFSFSLNLSALNWLGIQASQRNDDTRRDGCGHLQVSLKGEVGWSDEGWDQLLPRVWWGDEADLEVEEEGEGRPHAQRANGERSNSPLLSDKAC